ncbi:MAG: undecaprenyl-diphosphate phosphatase [Bacteroidales bacterium]|nr:undecaprenyl-diphosphate phosphatase [Porphyromonas sp.]MDD6934626.1 undecaprenyl-diphosphate phosphatase [Bacteroidales bacterium]MDY3101785.1 undecaprenyl-diphosphate phosphatase [Porphyromonas sp.]
MSILETIILAIVEGLTEFLPISSTGHMILAQGVMGMQSSDYSKAFTVMIQLGAILSVVVLYWRRFFIPGLQQDGRDHSHAPQRWKEFFLFYLKLVVGCIPAGILGLLFEKQIDALLDSVLVVAIMLLLGGILMVFVDRLFSESRSSKISFQNAFFVGLFQCIAMIPGVSRSMATIVGGQQQGLSRKTAAEFSFFLAIPTMLGATLLKAYKLFKEFGISIFVDNWKSLLVGNVIAFVVALLAIQFFIGFLTRYGFKYFGYYRIIVGAVILLLLAFGVELSIA